MPSNQLEQYKSYTRKEVNEILAPEVPYTPGSGTWGLQGIVRLNEPPSDFAFFVTYDVGNEDYDYEDRVRKDGVVSWTTQNQHTFKHRLVQELIHHNEASNSIYLFVRASNGSKYNYLGKLKYISHDPEKENPVHFKWQILDWEPDQVPQDSGILK